MGRWIYLWAFVPLGLALGAGHSVRAQTLDQARDLHRQGLLDEALAAYRQVAEMIEPTDPAGAAIARNNACVVLLGLGEPDAAVEQCRRALDLRRHAGDDRRLARTLNNLGLALQYTGRFEESRSSFLEALEINEVRDDFEAQAVNLANLGLVDTSAGRYERALRYYDQVNELAADHRDESWAEAQIWTARINRGVVLERLGAFEEALALYRDLIDGPDRPEPGRRAALLSNRGVVLRNLGDPVSALEDFDAAVQLYRSVGDQAGLSNALLNRGLVLHLNLGDLQSAEESFRAALELASAGGDRLEEIQDLFFLGRLLLDLGRLDEAEQAFYRCQRIADESGVAEGRWPALEGLGRVQRARGALEAALGYFREALDVIESQRELLSSPGRRSGYFGDKRPVYEATVDVLAELHASDPGREWAAEAFAVVQRAKARELLDVVGPGQSAARPLGADAVRRLLRSDLLLEYFVAETRLYLWVVWEGGLELSDLGSSEAILDEVADLQQVLSRARETDPQVVEDLSKVLLRGGEIPREKGSVTRIAPDGRLHLLPFEILIPAGAGKERLVELGAVGYLPSGSVLATLDRPAREARYALVGFGAPTGSREVRDRRFRLEPLPGAERELETAADLLPGSHLIRTGAGATRRALTEAVAAGAGVVHLATHTVVTEASSRGAAVVLAPEEEDDGLLFPDEIAAMDFPVALTVLASCRTAAGSDLAGRGLSTLSGAFLAAGSAAVVVTLWEVGDETTAAIMQQFYYFLARGDRPVEALRNAKLRLMADPRWNRPELWSGYVLIGESPPVAASRRGKWIALFLSFGASLGVLLWALRLSRRLRTSGAPS